MASLFFTIPVVLFFMEVCVFRLYVISVIVAWTVHLENLLFILTIMNFETEKLNNFSQNF